MSHHFNQQGNPKRSYDNFASANLECNKFNSNIDNLGQKRKFAYKCKICDKVHISREYKKTITIESRFKAFEKLNKALNSSILIKRIEI